MHALLFIALLTGISLVFGGPATFSLVSLDHAVKYEHAACLDGSSPAYYFRPGFGDGERKWYIHQEGLHIFPVALHELLFQEEAGVFLLMNVFSARRRLSGGLLCDLASPDEEYITIFYAAARPHTHRPLTWTTITLGRFVASSVFRAQRALWLCYTGPSGEPSLQLQSRIHEGWWWASRCRPQFSSRAL